MSVIGCHPMSRHPMNQPHLASNEATARMSQSEMSQSSMAQSPMSHSTLSTSDVSAPSSNVERRTFVARSNLFLNFNNRRNIQVGNIPLISPISILSPTSPNGTIFSQIRISPNSLASPLGENGFTLSRRLLGPPDKETETFINTVLELEKEHNKPKQNKENHQRIYEPGPATVAGLNRAGIHSTANQMAANRMARQESRDIKYDYNLSDISSNHSINNDQQSDMDYQMSEHSNESSDMGMVTSSVGNMTSSVTSSDNNHVIQQQHDQYYELIPVEHQDHSRDNLQIIYSTNQNSVRPAPNQNPCQPMAESHGNQLQSAMQDPYKPIPTTVILQQTAHKYDSSNMSHHSSSQQCRVIQHGLPSDQSNQSAITNPINQSSTSVDQSNASVTSDQQPIRSVNSAVHSQSNQRTKPSGSRAPSSSTVAKVAKSGKVTKKTPPARNHKCNICNKMFVRPAELQRHIRKHTGERPFKCDDCDMTFMRKDHLTSHQLKHRDQKQFKCRFCDYESNRGDTLKRHCKNKHKNEI